MLENIFLGLIIIYIIGVILWRLFFAIILIAEEGWVGALVVFLWSVWDLAKFAFGILILVLIFRGC